jgi:hypothetical protein
VRVQKVAVPTDCAVLNHYINFWKEAVACFVPLEGRVQVLPEGFRVAKFSPREDRAFWTYATVHMSASGLRSLELHVHSPKDEDADMVELLSMTASFHNATAELAWGHTVNIGQPWLGRSKCDHGLLSLPYLDGPRLERAEIGGTAYEFLWFIPVTDSEVEYRHKLGLDALEQRFEEQKFNYLDPNRKPVV